jgi:hypothetical protein
MIYTEGGNVDTRKPIWLVVDTAEIFQSYREACQHWHEIPAIDVDTDWEVDLFMCNLCSNLAWLPGADQGVEQLLRQHAEHFVVPMTARQHQFWINAGQYLKDKLLELGTYGPGFINKYDYHHMEGDTLVMYFYDQ